MRTLTATILIVVSAFLAFADYVQAEQRPSQTQVKISVSRHSRLSVNLKKARLIDVVKEIKRQTNIAFVIRVPGTPVVSKRFEDLPLERGLQKLFSDFDYALIQHEGNANRRNLAVKTIILVGRNMDSANGDRIETVIEAPSASVIHHDLLSHDPDIRKNTLLEMDDGDIEAYFTDITTLLINDPNEAVRVEAVVAVASYDNAQSLPLLVDALNDESKTVRNRVFDALSSIGTEEAMEALKAAIDNTD